MRLTQRFVGRIDQPVSVAVEEAVLQENGSLGLALSRKTGAPVRDAMHLEDVAVGGRDFVYLHRISTMQNDFRLPSTNKDAENTNFHS